MATKEGNLIARLALSQLGNNYQKYCSWFGWTDEWCAMYVSWLASQCNFIDKYYVVTAGAGTMPRICVPRGCGVFKTKASGYKPKEGDCVLYRYGGTYNDQYHSDHIGLVVTDCDSRGNYSTVEGNTNAVNGCTTSSVNRFYRNIYSNDNVYAFYVPKFNCERERDEMNFTKGDKSDGVLAYKSMLMQAKTLGLIKQSVNADNIFGDGTLKATIEIQRKYGLEEDGIAGKNTITALSKAITKKLSQTHRAETMQEGDWNLGVASYKAMCSFAKELGLITASTDTKLGFGDGTEKATKQIQALIGEKQTGVATKYTVEKLRVIVSNAFNIKLDKARQQATK